MKRFLVFVIICIVTLSLGLTTYYFLRDNESLIVLDSYFEINQYDTFVVGIEHENPNPATQIYYESLHPNIVNYNPVNEKFEAISGGRAIIRITSNKSDFKPVTIEVIVGDGTINAPFFVKSVKDILFIGKDEVFDANGNSTTNPKQFSSAYKLQADLDLSQLTSLDPLVMQNNGIDPSVYEQGVWIPIGNKKAAGEGFSGIFDFNGHTIYNMSILETDFVGALTVENAGLFATIEERAVIKNVTLENINIEGQFDNAGSIAGVNYGTIERTNILSGNITNLQNNSNTGGVVGSQEIINQLIPTVDMVYTNVTINGGLISGGLVGYNYGGIVINSYSESQILGNLNSTVGGIVGLNEFKEVGYDAIVKDCYYYGQITSTSTQKGAIIGENINEDDLLSINIIRGNYYSSEISGAIEGIGGIANEDLESHIGIFDKTIAELKLENTYYSYTDHQEALIYWSFTKTWILNADVNNGLPVLNMNAPKLDYGIRNIADGVSINTVNDLLNISMIGSYILRNNLDLSISTNDWIPLGTEEEPFNGYIRVDIDPLTGNPYIISNLIITSTRASNGLFGHIGTQGILDGITIRNVKILAGHNVGAVAGVNEGIIKNATVSTDESLEDFTMTAYNSTGEANVGAIVGINNQSIENGISNVSINAQSTSGNLGNAGGIAGNNYGSITEGYSLSTITTTGMYSKYIGGITGSNEGTISSVYFLGDLLAPVGFENIFIGGITGYHGANSTLEKSFVSDGTYQGYAVGALVGVSRGTIKESYSDIVNIKAQYAGGLVFNISLGEVINCYTLAFMAGAGSTSVKAGFAYFIEYHSSTDYGQVVNCFSAATYDPVGTNYAETAAPVRTEGFLVTRQAGYIKNSIYDAQGNILKSQNFVSFFNSNSELLIPKDKQEVSITDEHAKGTDDKGFSTFIEQNFSTTIWNFVEGNYPQLRNVVTIQE